jgi:hypothetical protein
MAILLVDSSTVNFLILVFEPLRIAGTFKNPFADNLKYKLADFFLGRMVILQL